MTQMNVRIDDALRIEGNLALESIGRSPSRTVRDVWAFAASCRDNPQKLKRALHFLDDNAASSDQREKLYSVQAIWSAMDASGALPAISPADATPLPADDTPILPADENPAPYAALKEQAYRERFPEGWSI